MTASLGTASASAVGTPTAQENSVGPVPFGPVPYGTEINRPETRGPASYADARRAASPSRAGSRSSNDAFDKQSAIEFRVVRGTAPVRRLRLTGSRYTFGSADGCSIRLNDPSLRPMHAVLIRETGRIYVRAYSVPVVVNNKPVKDAALAIGDRLELGEYCFELISVDHSTDFKSPEPKSVLTDPMPTHFSSSPAAKSNPFEQATTTPDSSSRLKNEIRDSDESIWRQRLRREIEQWRARQVECDERENRCDEREAHLRGRESELWSRAENLYRREAQVQSQESAVHQMHEEYALRQHELYELRDQTQDQKRLLDQREREMIQQEAEYRRKLEEATAQLLQSQAQAEAATEAVSQMRSQFESLNQQIEDLSGQQESLKEHESAQREQNQQLRDQLESQRDRAIDAQARSEAHRRAAETRVEEMTAELEAIKRQQLSSGELANKLATSDLIADDLRKKVQDLQSELDQATAEASRFRSDYEDTLESVRQLERLVARSRDKGDEDRSQWEAETDSLRSDIERLSADLESAGQELSKLRQQHEDLHIKLDFVEQERNEAIAEAKSRPSHDEVHNLQQDLYTANEALANLQREFDESASHNSENPATEITGSAAAAGIASALALAETSNADSATDDQPEINDQPATDAVVPSEDPATFKVEADTRSEPEPDRTDQAEVEPGSADSIADPVEESSTESSLSYLISNSPVETSPVVSSVDADASAPTDPPADQNAESPIEMTSNWDSASSLLSSIEPLDSDQGDSGSVGSSWQTAPVDAADTAAEHTQEKDVAAADEPAGSAWGSPADSSEAGTESVWLAATGSFANELIQDVEKDTPASDSVWAPATENAQESGTAVTETGENAQHSTATDDEPTGNMPAVEQSTEGMEMGGTFVLTSIDELPVSGSDADGPSLDADHKSVQPSEPSPSIGSSAEPESSTDSSGGENEQPASESQGWSSPSATDGQSEEEAANPWASSSVWKAETDAQEPDDDSIKNAFSAFYDESKSSDPASVVPADTNSHSNEQGEACSQESSSLNHGVEEAGSNPSELEDPSGLFAQYNAAEPNVDSEEQRPSEDGNGSSLLASFGLSPDNAGSDASDSSRWDTSGSYQDVAEAGAVDNDDTAGSLPDAPESSGWSQSLDQSTTDEPVLDHSVTPIDNAELFNSADAAEQIPAAPAAAPEPDAEQDDSIEAYMNRLLNRVQGTPESEMKSEPALAPASVGPAAMPSTSPTQPEVNATVPEQAPDEEIEPFDPLAPLVPRSAAPERSRDLNAMRELANQSARSAIDHSARNQSRDLQLAALINFGVVVASVILGLIATALLNGGIVVLAWVMVVIISVISIRDGLKNLAEGRRRMQSTKQQPTAGPQPAQASATN